MKSIKKVHFVGVGGVSMSALALLLQKKGYFVTGNDINPNLVLPSIDTSEDGKFQNIQNADIVVATSAVPQTDEALIYAKKLGKKICSRAQLLGQIAKQYQNVIAISGTHGKTTTTEMLAEIFIAANKNPTVHIGGISNKFESNLLIGQNNFFITEACEYTNSFLCLNPTVSVILNIEPEHLDFFENFECEKQSFLQFAKQSQVVVAQKKLGIQNAISFGSGGNFEVKNIKKNRFGYSFDVFKNQKKYLFVRLNSFVKTNISNALAAIAVSDFFGIEKKAMQQALKNFCGVKRRCQMLCISPIAIHDYAHHPSEIKSILLSAKCFFQKPILVVFQPHTYSRTKQLFDDFVEVLQRADALVLLPTYAARESLECGKSAKDLFFAIKQKNNNVYYFENFDVAKNFVVSKFSQHTILILGAGDIANFW